MVSNLSISALAITLVTMTALPALVGSSATTSPVIGGAVDTVRINADTGELLSEPAMAGTNVTIQLEGVASTTDSYDLHGPIGPLFLNQSARFDGNLAFWDVPAVPGEYSVRPNASGSPDTADGIEATVDPVVSFSPTRTQGCSSTYEGEQNCGYAWWGCGYYPAEKIAEEDKWTPVIMVNSPSEGRAQAASSWEKTRAVYIAPAEWESNTEHEMKVDAEDGISRGQFRLAAWGIYRDSDWTCSPEDREKTAKVVDWEPDGYQRYRTFNLTGAKTTSDADNLAQVNADGFESIIFDIRYRERNGAQDTTGGPIKREVRGEEIMALGGAVSVRHHFISFQVLKFEIAEGDKLSYIYEFPEGYEWFYDELAKSPALAFCRPAVEDCPTRGSW